MHNKKDKHTSTQKEDIAAVRNELKTEMVGIRSEIIGVKTEIDVRMDKLNNKIDEVIWFIVISILISIRNIGILFCST
jgi:hypothetical protein